MRSTRLAFSSALVGATVCWMIHLNFVSIASTKEQNPPSARPIEAAPLHTDSAIRDAQLEEIAELRFRLDTLLMTVEALEVRQRELAALQVQSSDITLATLEEEVSSRENPLDSEQDGREQWENFRLAVHASVEDSEPDPNQASLASEEIIRRLANEPDDVFSLQDVSCGTTICRIRLHMARNASPEPGLEPILPDFLPWEAEALIEENERDPSQLIIHLARKGKTLSGAAPPNSGG